MEEERRPAEVQRVRLVDLDIGIIDLAAFLVRLAIASIPAALALSIIGLIAYRAFLAVTQ